MHPTTDRPAAARIASPRPPVRCACGRAVFDGHAVRARVVLVDLRGDTLAKCQCKRWVSLPLHYQPPP